MTPKKQIKKRFQELAQCRNCGTSLPNNRNHCPSCGRIMIAWWKWVLGVLIWLLLGLTAVLFVFKT